MLSHPSAPAPLPPSAASLVRVAGGDALEDIRRILAAAGCSAPGCVVGGGGYGGPPPNPDLPVRQLFDQAIAPSTAGMAYGPNAIIGGACKWRDGSIRPVRASYIGGTLPAVPLGTVPATAPAPFNLQTNTHDFLGFKFMAPDALMGVGIGLQKMVVNSYDYLDAVTPIPIEVFNALSDNETQGRIDLCWLQAPNAFAQLSVSAVASGTTAVTTAQLVCFQGFLSAP